MIQSVDKILEANMKKLLHFDDKLWVLREYNLQRSESISIGKEVIEILPFDYENDDPNDIAFNSPYKKCYININRVDLAKMHRYYIQKNPNHSVLYSFFQDSYYFVDSTQNSDFSENYKWFLSEVHSKKAPLPKKPKIHHAFVFRLLVSPTAVWKPV